MKLFNYDSKFSRIMTRIFELVLLNFVFILTCIPIFTIGASLTALYATTLKMVRSEEGYVIRGYFKAFAQNFKRGTLFWVIALALYFVLYVIRLAANIQGGSLATAYTVICAALAILYSFYFLFVFTLTATFENTIKGTMQTALAMIIAHFPRAFAAWLTVALPLFVSFGITNQIMEYALLFWILIGFSVLALWSSFYINQIFVRYMGDDYAPAKN